MDRIRVRCTSTYYADTYGLPSPSARIASTVSFFQYYAVDSTPSSSTSAIQPWSLTPQERTTFPKTFPATMNHIPPTLSPCSQPEWSPVSNYLNDHISRKTIACVPSKNPHQLVRHGTERQAVSSPRHQDPPPFSPHEQMQWRYPAVYNASRSPVRVAECGPGTDGRMHLAIGARR